MLKKIDFFTTVFVQYIKKNFSIKKEKRISQFFLYLNFTIQKKPRSE